MNVSTILQENGFTANESAVYLALLQTGNAPASSIAKRSNINRTTCYVSLKKLMKKGAVHSYRRQKVQYFSAREPELLVGDIIEKGKKLLEAMPELTALMKSSADTPTSVEYYEGVTGLIDIMEDTLTTKSGELYCFSNIEKATEALRDYYPKYIRKKNDRNIKVFAVFNYGPVALRFKKWQERELREAYLVPDDLFPFENEVNIYNDKIAIISHEDLIGVIIRNQFMANTFKSMYKMNFEYAKILEKSLLTEKDRVYLASRESYQELHIPE